MKRLIDHFKPQHLFVALADWHDLATSFWTIDWGRLCHEQENVRGGKLTLGCYEDGRGVLNALKDECLPGIDHAMVYLPPDGACSSKAIKLRKEINEVELNHAVTYLGYTCDEHNMVWNSWNSLARQPRIYRTPQQPLKGRMVICGSGPSLDDNIEQLRVLSKTHFITACGSNFRTLKSKGVRVDFLALVERADVVYEDIKSVVQEYGSGETRLILSSSCHHQLQELFVDSMVYFRPALTPLALFSSSPSEVLCFEGPESINAGVAFASTIGMDEVVLVGVDLGTRSLSKVRSADAVGNSPRNFDLEVPGNFGGTVYTSVFMRDARMTVESCFRCYANVRGINVSDGVKIEGAESMRIEDYILSLVSVSPLSNESNSGLRSWWESSPRYTPQRFLASWKSRRPRPEIANLISELRKLFSSSLPWKPDLLYQVNKLMDLNQPPSVQFPEESSAVHCSSLSLELIGN